MRFFLPCFLLVWVGFLRCSKPFFVFTLNPRPSSFVLFSYAGNWRDELAFGPQASLSPEDGGILCTKILPVAAICRVPRSIQEAQLIHHTVAELMQLRDILEDAGSYLFMTQDEARDNAGLMFGSLPLTVSLTKPAWLSLMLRLCSLFMKFFLPLVCNRLKCWFWKTTMLFRLNFLNKRL
jgi:hypothetical protein